MLRANSLEKPLMLGKIEGKGKRRQQGLRWLDGVTDSVDVSWSKLWETGNLLCCSPWGHKELDTT